MRSMDIGRKNYFFFGAQTAGHAAAIANTLIETATLNGGVPQAWPSDTQSCFPDSKTARL